MTDKEVVKQMIVDAQERLSAGQLVEREVVLPVGSGKIITVPGVRRCGKSTLLLLTIGRLLAEGVDRSRILFFNFDDERIRFDHTNLDLILTAFRELYPDQPLAECHLFFDEVQMAEGWQPFVRRVYEEECRNLYLTGSNSQMLSSEIASALRGRSLQYEEYPLSFAEVCRFRGVKPNVHSSSSAARLAALFDEYLEWGGFPEVVMADPTLKARILGDYFYVMLYRDLVEHFRITHAEVARYFIRRVMENITKPTSVNKIFRELKSQGVAVSKERVYSLAEWCEAIYLFLPLRRHAASVQRSTTSDTKFYCIDMGLRRLTLKPQSDDNGKALENAVFLALRRTLRDGQTLCYHRGDFECDFVLAEGFGVQSLVQVTWELGSGSTREREVRGLVEAARATGCRHLTIVTHDEELALDSEAGPIRVLPAWKWMLTEACPSE